jgi:hypothetical protein
MNVRSKPRVTFSDRLNDGIVVGFDDGTTAFYSAELLRSTLPQAQMMPSDAEDATRLKASDVR